MDVIPQSSAFEQGPGLSFPMLLTLVLAITGFLFFFMQWPGSFNTSTESNIGEASESETLNPLILRDNSELRSYVTPNATYGSIRTFYHPHPHTGKLPEAKKLPLIVFIHGLGGSLVQFAPLIRSLVNICPCFGIDFPGCGLSEFSPEQFSAYSIDALVALAKSAIEAICRQHGHESVIIVAHSYGCPISALLISQNAAEGTAISLPVLGFVAICPKASRPTRRQTRIYRIFLMLPNFVINIFRWMDKRGGIDSASVTRFVGPGADIELKRLQLRLNARFKTAVWKRVALGALSSYPWNGVVRVGLPGEDIWNGIDIPLLLIAGEADTVTKLDELDLIVSYLKGQPRKPMNDRAHSGVTEFNDSVSLLEDNRASKIQTATTESTSRHLAVIKTAILPAPAAHALLYAHATYRTVAGLIEDFLSKHVSNQLSLGWQLQQITTTGKWDVKNLEKWKKVMPVSGLIAGHFRALKTLREQDEEHTPTVFVERWHGKIYAVIDISHDRPIYNTQVLDRGGIQYHKFPTVSKVPPTSTEVKGFIALVDRLRNEIQSSTNDSGEHSIAVHCHYGYNRTGFFIIAYLVEKENWRLQDAIDEFALQKPPGIRHDHFLDTLFVRYCVGLRKAPTFP